jgi:diguanylate cyclase (GGDEF)-like protein/PAS domain S-box-containing protein
VSEWIYILWVAVGTTGFWESVEAISRIREFDWLPKWTWTVIAGMVPIAWIALMQVFVHPFNLLIYGIISVIYMGMLAHRHQSRWYSTPLLALQFILFFTVPVWHMQADRFWVVIVVEVVAIWLSSMKVSPLWASIGLFVWVFVKPVFLPAHDQVSDFIDLLGLFVPLFLYMRESSHRQRIVFERAHDALTGLYNRMSFNDWLLDAKGTSGVLMMIDLDDFKYVNDTFGHQVGDQVLVETGRRISHAMPKHAKAFRWGGDEFVIVFQNTGSQDTMHAIVQAVHTGLVKEPAPMSDGFSIHASMGVAQGEFSENLLMQADQALLYTKRAGKNQVEWYQEQRENGEKTTAFPMDFATIRENERNLRIANSLWENAPEGMLITDEAGIIVRVNRTFTTVTGYTASEVVGKNPRVLQSGMHSSMFYRDMWQAIEQGGKWQGKIANRKKNGEVYWEWLQIHRIMDESGHLLFYLATFWGLDQLQTLENAIRQ